MEANQNELGVKLRGFHPFDCEVNSLSEKIIVLWTIETTKSGQLTDLHIKLKGKATTELRKKSGILVTLGFSLHKLLQSAFQSLPKVTSPFCNGKKGRGLSNSPRGTLIFHCVCVLSICVPTWGTDPKAEFFNQIYLHKIIEWISEITDYSEYHTSY